MDLIYPIAHEEMEEIIGALKAIHSPPDTQIINFAEAVKIMTEKKRKDRVAND